MDASNLRLIDPILDKPTDIKFGYLEDGTWVRISLLSGSIIPFPDYEKWRLEFIKDKIDGPLDTLP